ncbi:hypothetical protein [Neorhodopirellula lusitana]|uniref:hypothetical protein n=1 Tax=Neorhodopirellula lusitana TaxID=445327 RepID=UPI00385134B4
MKHLDKSLDYRRVDDLSFPLGENVAPMFALAGFEQRPDFERSERGMPCVTGTKLLGLQK